MKKINSILVTGGCGFIGSNIVKKIRNLADLVIVVDNLSLGKQSYITNYKNVKFINCDIMNFDLIKFICESFDVEYIIHQAAASSSPMFTGVMNKAVSTNIQGFINILEAARLTNVKKIVYASSSSIYGNSPFTQSESIQVNPPNFYSLTKYMNEHLARLYKEIYNIDSVGLRYFSVFGPHEEHKKFYANVITQFIWAILQDEPPVIYGDGTQTRDFIYVEDVVNANICALTAPTGVYNIGTGVETTFNEIIKIIAKIIDKKIRTDLSPLDSLTQHYIIPKYKDNPISNYVENTKADIKLATEKLKFKAKTPLKKGIEKTINYYMKLKEKERLIL